MHGRHAEMTVTGRNWTAQAGGWERSIGPADPIVPEAERRRGDGDRSAIADRAVLVPDCQDCYVRAPQEHTLP